MRDTVYFLAFDGFVDWHAAQALCEIRRPGDWRLQTVGFSLQPVLSMGGLRVLPELTLDQLDLDRAALLILPGGHLWEHGYGEEAVDAARRVHAVGAPVAAVDSGVLALARAGLLDHCRHTGNWPGQIDSQVSTYAGADQYDPQVLAVSDGGVITASQLGSVEFAREVIRTLDLYNASDREHWYRLYKHAVPPPWCVGATTTATAVAA
ncbi:thiamine biosynthesis protein ThiJ [Dyella solisilvae]|uniref:Thiamine biosynthesis protein ThiJ n=1 Tax=Dyella solisilvae TaxID=1920168 RepID=A0A370K902_9GAMM|nr:DJ-1/PfpI family protein [Dyella solisilvae]RDI99119.1 thiamine biosynthesis protein ThiJ [Dyella solisilvae]